MKTLNEMINETTKAAREEGNTTIISRVGHKMRKAAVATKEFETEFGVVTINVAPRQGSRKLSTYFKLNNKRIKLVDLENMFMATA